MSGRGILDAEMHTVGRWIAGGLSWWTGQLRELVPPRLRAGGLMAEPVFLAETDGGGVAFDDGVQVQGRALVLPPGHCLIRQIERPLASEADLERMIALDADRLMPLGREGTVIAARTLTRDPVRRLATIEVAGLLRDRAQHLGAELVRLGAVPAAIFARAPVNAGAAPADFLPALRRAGLLPDHRQSATRWWIAVVFLFSLNLGIIVWRDVASVDRLEDIVASQQPAVAVAQRIRAQMLADRNIARQTQEARTNEPLLMLNRLGGALPAGVWLKSYTWQGDSLRLAGFRPASADVSGALRDAGFGRVRYAGNAASAASPLGQPFEVTAVIEGR